MHEEIIVNSLFPDLWANFPVFKAIEVSITDNLLPFSRALWASEIPHRITEHGGMQQLWVQDEASALEVRDRYTAFLSGADLPAGAARPRRPQVSAVARTGRLLARVPVTLIVFASALLVAAITRLGEAMEIVRWFTIVEFAVEGRAIAYPGLDSLLETHQYWRILSPVLIHFGTLHLVFNLLWLWVLGLRIEGRHGPLRMLALVIFIGISSSIAQFAVSGPLFGGLSGIVYGLLGYIWMWQRLDPRTRFDIPPGIMIFMVVWLLLGFGGVLTAMGLGAVANTAHGTGLVGGVALAVLGYALRSRPRPV